MWYLNLMHGLLEKLPEISRQQGEQFLDGLFSMVKTIENNPEMSFFLGLIEKSFLKFENEAVESVDLTQFSRHILGLTLVYLKASDDLAIWNSDFIPQLGKIRQFLDLDKEGRTTIKLLNQFEAEAFSSLNYQANINFVHLRIILKKNGSLETAQSFVDACKNFTENGSSGYFQLIEDAEEMLAVDALLSATANLGSIDMDETNSSEEVIVDNRTLNSTNELHRLSIFKALTHSSENMIDINQNFKKGLG